MALTEAQLAERYTGIGGSDAAAALGLSPWKSPLELFLDKRERRDTVPNAAMRWGTLLEPVLRQEYASRTGRTVRLPPDTIRHQQHKWMLAHFDGVTDDERIFEAKTARSLEGFGAGGEDVPHHYLIQVQHYMAVSGLKLADIAVLIGGSDFRIYEIEADPEMQGLIIEGEQAFWKCVESNNPPSPDFDTGDPLNLMRRLYPGTNGKTVQANTMDITYRTAYENAALQAKTYERVAEGAKAHLLYQMRDAAVMTFPDGMQLTRKMVNRKGYSVEPTEYVDSRFTRIKETA